MQAPSDPTLDSRKPPRRRSGRPSAKQVGDVDRRILDAATDLFLRLGFDATSCGQVVTHAGVGKASLYARYANKEELFAAVMRGMMDRAPALSDDVPRDLSLRERLRAVGHRLLAQALDPQSVALMRMVMTIAQRMPELAGTTDRAGRDNGIKAVALAIAGGDTAPEAIESAFPAARVFVDLVLLPQQMRALIGDDPAELEAEGARRIDDVIDLLLHARLKSHAKHHGGD